VPQQLRSRNKPKKQASSARAGIFAVAAAYAAAAAAGMGAQPARAIVVPTAAPPGRAEPLATPTGTPNSTVLPLNSSVFFVLDDTVSSRSRTGVVRAHLRDPIVLRGVTIAPAGTPVNMVITQASAAQAGNVDGFVEVYFEELRLASGKMLPLNTPTAHISPHMTAGQESTRGVTDTVGDIFIPGHYIYHLLRKGADVTLRPGTVIRARTGATVHVTNAGAVAISTPAPFRSSLDTPHPDFQAAPLATPPGFHAPTPKPSPSVHPTTTP
jgi:hypothetical protein